jgi:homoserine dehydrogenase
MRSPVIVLKFGSSVLAGQGDLARATEETRRWLEAGRRVVAVVSALAGATDELLRRARAVAEEPAREGLAAYLASGERQAAALLHLALERAGTAATLVDPFAIGLRAAGDLLDGEPRGLDRRALAAALARCPVAILPGFFGIDAFGRVTLFGRGGSDWTALFVAWALGAECRLLKDVDGIFEHDPRRRAAGGRFVTLHHADALALQAPIVQARALRFAAATGLEFTVAAIGSAAGTRVGPQPTRLSASRPRTEALPEAAPRPVRVATEAQP